MGTEEINPEAVLGEKRGDVGTNTPRQIRP